MPGFFWPPARGAGFFCPPAGGAFFILEAEKYKPPAPQHIYSEPSLTHMNVIMFDTSTSFKLNK